MHKYSNRVARRRVMETVGLAFASLVATQLKKLKKSAYSREVCE